MEKSQKWRHRNIFPILSLKLQHPCGLNWKMGSDNLELMKEIPIWLSFCLFLISLQTPPITACGFASQKNWSRSFPPASSSLTNNYFSKIPSSLVWTNFSLKIKFTTYRCREQNVYFVSFLFCFWRASGVMSRMFANGPGGRGSIPGQVIPKTKKMVLDANLLNTQHYNLRIKGKVEQSRERTYILPYTLV